ncbi:NAD-dependent epimerase/dehydratase family protein [Akkermansiaceae bacterium]|nr:NAD-dependent epimerase/dehydratase family protein [Akkermansiaceae bacterium]
MKIMILGGDGYLGWPTAMHLAGKGHEVLAIDNYSRRNIAMQTSSEALINNPNLEERAKVFEEVSSKKIHVAIGDLTNFRFFEQLVIDFKPEAIIHYAEQPSAPYSMKGYEEAHFTLKNNLEVTHNVIWGVLKHIPDCHIVKLGTMGEYGTPNIDIEEGWLDVEHKGRKQKFLYPRQAGSLYHTTKVLDTDLLWFYVRTHDLKVTDLMQGPVYGISTPEADMDERLMPNFHYDDIFGTLVNRFVIQAVCGVPLTVYGKGGQIRGYLNLNDTLQCVELALSNPVGPKSLRILNQFTETFSVNQVAEIVKRVGDYLDLKVEVKSIPNPRKEPDNHYYNPSHSGLMDLGLTPHYLTDEVMENIMKNILKYKDNIDRSKIMPRVTWNK